MFGMGKKSNDKKRDAKAPEPKPAVVPQAAQRAGTSQNPKIQPPPHADFVVEFAKAAEGAVLRGSSISASTCDGFVTLGGGVATTASSGIIRGAYTAVLPDAFEANASGRKIRMTVLARATSTPVNFQLAYSTNEVGNSGWKMFEAGVAFTEHTLEWAVPPMKDGRGDFAGIQPPLAGEGTIDVAWLSLTIK